MTNDELHTEFKRLENKFKDIDAGIPLYSTRAQMDNDIARHGDLGMELSRRGYWTTSSSPSYDRAATPQHSPAVKSSSGPVYSTRYARLFHRSECSKLSSKDGGLIEFPSKENAEKNGGKPCPECNP